MSNLKTAIAKLAVEFSRNSDQQDRTAFDVVRTIVTQGDPQATITAILAIAEQGPKSVKQSIGNAFIVSNQPLYLQTAAAVALSYIGSDAQQSLIELLVRQPSQLARHTLLKAMQEIKQPWMLGLLLTLAQDNPAYPSALANHILREVMYYNNLYTDYLREQLPEKGPIPDTLIADIIVRQPDALLTTIITWLDNPDRIDQALQILTDNSVTFYKRAMTEEEAISLVIRSRANHIIANNPTHPERLHHAYNLLLMTAADHAEVEALMNRFLLIVENQKATVSDRKQALQFIRQNVYLTRNQNIKKAERRELRVKMRERFKTLLDDDQLGEPIAEILDKLGYKKSLSNKSCAVCGETDDLKQCLNCKKIICKQHTSHHSYCSEKCWGDYNYRLTGNPNPQYW